MNIGSIASKGWNYIQRAGRIYPDFVMGTGNEAFTNAMRSTIKNRAANGQSYMQSVWSGIKNGAIKAEEHNKIANQRHGGFWKSTWHALKTTPKKIAQGWRVGGKLADRAGKTGLSKTWAQFKGSLKGLGKRMPLIFSLMVVLPELPNLFSAFKDKGLVGGVAETGKTALRLGAGMTGAAIGQALIPIPILGGIVGYMAGDWLMSKFTGKSHSEKKAELEEAQQQQIAQQQAMMQQYNTNPFGTNTNPTTVQPQFNIPKPTMTPEQLMAMKQMLYNNSMANPMDQDFMAMTSGINRLNYLG
ncbi:unknown [Clostridium sp. CAG:768]|nr:unknown [Clostridium sp. CAG:768]